MKILYVVTQSDFGGAQKYVAELAEYFQGEIAYGEDGVFLPKFCEEKNIKGHHLKYLRREINPIIDLLGFFELLFLFSRRKVDVVHLNSSKAGALGSIAGWLTGKKVIYTAHGFVFNEPLPNWKKNFYIFIEKLTNIFKHKIIAVSENDRQSGIAQKICDENKIVTIHNGIKPINFLSREEARRKFGIGDEFVFGVIANDYPAKGLGVLIEAFKKLDLDNTKLLIIGDTKRVPEKNMIFPGPIASNPPASAHLLAIDCFVLPSLKEGFAYALIEAMQAGLPIIATDVGGNKEALGDAGILVLAGDPSKLAEVMNELHADPELRGKLGVKTKERSNEFTFEIMSQKTQDIYSQ